MTLSESVAVVTGASSGIGEATARALSRSGCSVVLAARREERLEAIAADLDGETLVVPTDVSDPDDAESLVERTTAAFGGIDILVNNAGIARGGPVGEGHLTELRRTVRVNLEGVMNVTEAALPALKDRAGDVVTISSLSARYPQAGGSGYTASKFGVNGFCRSLRKELGDDDVRVTTLMPGAVSTELNDWEHWDGRAMEPADIADLVVVALTLPAHVELTEVSVDTTDKM